MSDYQPHEAPARDAQSMPAVVPPKLVGRDPALKQIYSQLKEGNPVHIHGASGVGKTAIAATLASAYAQQPGGVLWLNVDNPRLEDLLVMVGRAYGIDEITNNDNPIGMIGAAENTLTQNKPLVVLDGTVSADVATRFITRCADGLPAMIVNQQKLDGPWGALELPPLSVADAVALFKQEARITDAAQDAPIGELVKQVAFMPLGIVVAAKAMLASKQQPGEYARVLEQVSAATGGSGSVVALATSFRALTNALQGMLLLMGATFNGQASAHFLSAMSGAPVDNVKQAMNIMTQLRLVQMIQRYDAPFYVLHPISHKFIETWLKTSNRLDTLRDKVRDTVLAYATQHSTDYDKLAADMNLFLATAQWANENGQTDVVDQLVTALNNAGDFVRERGYVYEVIKLRNLARGSVSAFPGHPEEPAAVAVMPEDDLIDDDDFYGEDDDFDDDDESVADFAPAPTFSAPEDSLSPEDLLTSVPDDVGDDEDSERISPTPPPPALDLDTTDTTELRSMLAQLKQANDTRRQVDVLKKIGQLQVERDMNNEAVATYGELLEVYEELGNERGMLETLDMVSALMVKNDNSQAAIMHANRGVKLAESLDETTTRMHLQTTLGDARQQLGESNPAVDSYLQALEIARNSNDTQNEAIILYKLGYAQLDSGASDHAVETWEQALALFRAQEKRAYEGRVLGALGSAYGDLGRWSEALSFLNSALHIAREVKDTAEEAQHLNSLGYAAVQANDLPQAVMRYRQALHLAFENNNKDDIVSNIVDLARLLVESRKHLRIAKLLIDRAIAVEPNDPDVNRLTQRINSEIMLAEAYGTDMLPVNGTAEQYAANAYALLEA